jgi:HSP20 family molecular chaperone IbpA
MAEETPISKPAAPEAQGTEYTRGGTVYRPHVDIVERDDELLVLADMPGTAGDLIDIDFEGGELTIHARVPPRQPAGGEYLLREYGVGDYLRTFRVSEKIDAGKISAEYADGVLTLHLPKAEALRPRKISVRA